MLGPEFPLWDMIATELRWDYNLDDHLYGTGVGEPDPLTHAEFFGPYQERVFVLCRDVYGGQYVYEPYDHESLPTPFVNPWSVRHNAIAAGLAVEDLPDRQQHKSEQDREVADAQIVRWMDSNKENDQ